MSVTLAVQWRAREGEEETVARMLEAMTPPTRAEAGCIHYYAHRATDEPRDFLLYEQWVSEAALKEHMETEHFKEHVQGTALPRLESRQMKYYEVIGADASGEG